MLQAKSILERKKRRHIFSLLLYELYEENSVCGKDRNAKVLIRERLGGRDTKEVKEWEWWWWAGVRESLMEMDQTKVEIRWGNWENGWCLDQETCSREQNVWLQKADVLMRFFEGVSCGFVLSKLSFRCHTFYLLLFYWSVCISNLQMSTILFLTCA